MKEIKTKKPWGFFERFTLNETSTVKILTLNPKKRISLQFHRKRKEFWRILEGPAKVTIGKKTFKAQKGKEFSIPPKTLHRIQAYNKKVTWLEIAFGKFDEKDIVRLEDDYHRE